MYKQLPDGLWFTLGSLPPSTTDEEVQAFLQEAGIELPLERISTSGTYDRAAAIISLPREEMQSLVQRAIGDNPLNGRVPELFIPASKRGGR